MENPHHEPGAIPARESNATPQSNMWVQAAEALFDGVRTRPMRWEDYAAFERMAQQARASAAAKRPAPTKQAIAEGEQLRDAFERACLHGGLGPTAH